MAAPQPFSYHLLPDRPSQLDNEIHYDLRAKRTARLNKDAHTPTQSSVYMSVSAPVRAPQSRAVCADALCHCFIFQPLSLCVFVACRVSCRGSSFSLQLESPEHFFLWPPSTSTFSLTCTFLPPHLKESEKVPGTAQTVTVSERKKDYGCVQHAD